MDAGEHPRAFVSADFDSDGLNDLLIVGSGHGEKGEPNRILMAAKAKTIRDGAYLSAEELIDSARANIGANADKAKGIFLRDRSHGACVADVDGDGVLDLFITNFEQGNRLFIGAATSAYQKVPRFQESFDLPLLGFPNAPMAGAAKSQGCLFFDADNDGDLDLYVINGIGQPNSLYVGKH